MDYFASKTILLNILKIAAVFESFFKPFVLQIIVLPSWQIHGKLDWGSYVISIAKTASKEIGALICSMNFFSPEVALYLYKSMYGILLSCLGLCAYLLLGIPRQGVVLVHDTQSNDSRSNDAQFMHKLCKHGYFI